MNLHTIAQALFANDHPIAIDFVTGERPSTLTFARTPTEFIVVG